MMVVLGAVVSSAVAAAGVCVVAGLTDASLPAVGAGVAAGVAVCLAWGTLIRPVRWARARRRAMSVAAVATLAVLLSLSWAVPRTPGVAPVDPADLPRPTSLALPDGTQLTVYIARAAHATAPPMIFVHGGPGVADPVGDFAEMSKLATDRDVYVYDQIGTGTSSRLSDVRGYTLGRSVSDLAAVVQLTGAAKVELVAHSYGAAIATLYTAREPGRVDSLVLVAPGPPPLAGHPFPPQDVQGQLTGAERARLYALLMAPRNLFVYGLTSAAPQVSHRMVGDVEADARFARIFARTRAGMFCDHAVADRIHVSAVGNYAHQLPGMLVPEPDLASATELAGIQAPVLVIKPQCDYIPWAVTAANVTALPTSRLVMLPGAGHAAYVEQPGPFVALVRAFWAGRPLPLPEQSPEHIPPEYAGTP